MALPSTLVCLASLTFSLHCVDHIIGTDSYNAQQLGFAYAAAQALGFKVFLSFDFGYWNSGGTPVRFSLIFPPISPSALLDTSTIASYINTYGVLPAQFIYNGEIFVSTFVGDGFNWATVASQSKPLFACPNYQAASLAGSSGVSCLFSWDAVSSCPYFGTIYLF